MWVVVWVNALTRLVQNTALTLVLSTLDSINHWQGNLCTTRVLSRQFHTETHFYSNWFSKYPANPLISPYHLLSSLMLGGRNEGRTGWGQTWVNTQYCKVTTPWLFGSVTMGLAGLQLLLKDRIQIYWKISEINPSEILFLGSAVTLLPDLQVHIGPWHHDLFCKHSMIWLLSLEMPLCLHGRCFSWRVTHIKLLQVALSFHS